MTVNKNLEPLALFGLLVVGDQALNLSHATRVQEMPPDLSRSAVWYRISLVSGETVELDGDDATAFREQLIAILRQAQFGASGFKGLKN